MMMPRSTRISPVFNGMWIVDSVIGGTAVSGDKPPCGAGDGFGGHGHSDFGFDTVLRFGGIVLLRRQFHGRVFRSRTEDVEDRLRHVGEVVLEEAVNHRTSNGVPPIPKPEKTRPQRGVCPFRILLPIGLGPTFQLLGREAPSLLPGIRLTPLLRHSIPIGRIPRSEPPPIVSLIIQRNGVGCKGNGSEVHLSLGDILSAFSSNFFSRDETTMRHQTEDLTFGKASEMKNHATLESFVGTPLASTPPYHCFDFTDKENTVYVELKTRRIKHNQYPTTLIGKNKVDFCSDPSKRYYFCYAYLDGLYAVKYDADLFKTFEVDDEYTRSDRAGCRNGSQQIVHIPSRYLTAVAGACLC